MAARPITIPIVAGFLIAATIIAAIVGISILFPNRFLDRLWELNKPGAELFKRIGPISGIFLMMLGAGTGAAAYGLLQRKIWAWWFAVVLFVVDGTGDIVAAIMTHDFLRTATGVAISSVFIWALTRDRVRRYFT